MAINEYTQALEKGLTDLERRIEQRYILNAEIAGLRETVRVLSARILLSDEERKRISRLLDMVDYATPSLADSIRAALTRSFPKGMTAIEVRDVLEELQFNFGDFSNSLSACHAALKRMLSDKEVAAEQTNDGKTSYRKILKLTPPPQAPRYGATNSLANMMYAQLETEQAIHPPAPPNRLTKPPTLPAPHNKGGEGSGKGGK